MTSANAPASPPSSKQPFIGRSVTRLEDLPLVTGRGRYAAGISFPHQLHMRVVRSNYAHGRIVAVDTARARALPGCVAVWTADDITDLPPIEYRETQIKGLGRYRQPILATGKVRYVGEAIAVVFAEDSYIAEDAADLVEIEIEEFPVIVSAHQQPGEFDPGCNTEPTIIRRGYGDVDAAFRDAFAVVELRDLKIGRHSGVPMETRGAIARYDAMRDVLEVYGAAKKPHPNRDLIAQMLKRSPSSVHLYEGHTGGSFGVRGELYPEDVLVCAAALRLGRPIKWIEDRRENLMACNHSRQQGHDIRAAVDKDGRILAIDSTFYHDQGAYVRTHGARVADGTAGMMPGPYRVPAYKVVAHYRLTNKTPCGTYRSPGRFETTFVCERLMDAISARMGIDRVEIRRRNLISHAEMPYTVPLSLHSTPVIYDTGDYAGLLDKALARIGWDDLLKDIKRRKGAGESVGIGLAYFIEKAGLGTVDVVRIAVDPSGTVEVITGAASVGQGMETALAQICADALGVDYRRVRVVHGRTDRIDYGSGAHAARITMMTGSATHIAALKVRAKAIEIAATAIQEPYPGKLDIIDGRIAHRDRPDGPSMTLAEAAKAAAAAIALAQGREPGLSAEGAYYSDYAETFPYGLHIAVVNVDRETGGVAIERYLAAYDIGRAINPMLVEGQIVGSMVQGLGGALFEEFTYADDGTPLSVTFVDYVIPTSREVPDVEVLLTQDAPSPRNPLGVKGGGESGTTGAGAAIASAIDDALNMPGAVKQLPITPIRLKQIINRATSG